MPFTAETLRYLQGLTKHNTKLWFEEHRTEYEAFVKSPMLALIEELDVRLARIAPEIIGDPKKSMFRIYRDVRFSKDKSPYKTHASCWLFHRDGSRSVGREAGDGGAGFYFQIAPGNSFLGGGLWMPPRPSLNKIRDTIAEKPKAFDAIARDPKLTKRFGGLSTEGQLKRMPRGYAEEHPAADWLRLTSFTVGRELSDAEAISPKLPALLEKDYLLMVPLIRWINATIGLKPAKHR